jgi:hypothetical protein
MVDRFSIVNFGGYGMKEGNVGFVAGIWNLTRLPTQDIIVRDDVIGVICLADIIRVFETVPYDRLC